MLQQSAAPVQAGGSHGVAPPFASYALREAPRVGRCGKVFVFNFGYEGDAESTVCCIDTTLHRSNLHLLPCTLSRARPQANENGS